MSRLKPDGTRYPSDMTNEERIVSFAKIGKYNYFWKAYYSGSEPKFFGSIEKRAPISSIKMVAKKKGYNGYIGVQAVPIQAIQRFIANGHKFDQNDMLIPPDIDRAGATYQNGKDISALATITINAPELVHRPITRLDMFNSEVEAVPVLTEDEKADDELLDIITSLQDKIKVERKALEKIYKKLELFASGVIEAEGEADEAIWLAGSARTILGQYVKHVSHFEPIVADIEHIIKNLEGE